MDELSIKSVIKQICLEKGLSEESVLETINSALAAAFRKDFADKTQNVVAEFDVETGKTRVFDVKEVVEDLTPEELAEMEKIKAERERIKEALAKGEITPEELRKQREEERAKRETERAEKESEKAGEEDEERRFNPRNMIQLFEAKKIKKSFKIGDFVKTPLEIPGEFGRMAAQTAKQVIVQRLREAERNVVYLAFKDREGKILNGMVQKIEGRNVIIDLDKTPAILPPMEQIRNERYKIGDRLKVYLKSVSLSTRGPELIVSRAHSDIVKELFTLEIPEIANNTIEIKGIAREAGNRTKIAVATEDKNIDPIGSCIGQRGARIQTIIRELGGEKIDIIAYSDDPAKYITNAIMPAKVAKVELREKEKIAIVTVPADQLSLTIGKAGQNVRLASKLTGWTININELKQEQKEEAVEPAKAKTEKTAEPIAAELPPEFIQGATEESSASADATADKAEPEKKKAKKAKKSKKE
ncbi:MAG: transcription termination factor NusA [Parcubacteria group bacterium]